jgi:hypothetical protein
MASRPPTSISAAAKLSCVPATKASWGATTSRNDLHYSLKNSNPFGAMLADEIFQNWDYAQSEEQCGDSEYSDAKVLPEEEYWYQLDLPLENVRELEQRFRQEISKFQRAYRKMSVYALQWHHLMEEIEDSAQVEKMFKDLQMVRKLTGSDAV